MQVSNQCPSELSLHAVKKICEANNKAKDKKDIKEEIVALQVADLTIFEGEKVKKNIKGRAILSDGVTTVICMLPIKMHDQVVSAPLYFAELIGKLTGKTSDRSTSTERCASMTSGSLTRRSKASKQ